MRQVAFYTRSQDELPNYEPERPYKCALCKRDVRGRVIASWKMDTRVNGIQVTSAEAAICGCGGVTTFYKYPMGGPRDELIQVPAPQRFCADPRWPEDLALLFNEAALAHSRGAHVSTAMLCRRLLMVCAWREGAGEGYNQKKSGGQFFYSVDFLVEKVLKDDRARKALIKVKDIGRDANHVVEEVSEEEARYALRATEYLLNTVYSVPEFEE